MNSKDDDNDNDIAWWFDAAMAKDNDTCTAAQEEGHLIPKMPFGETAVMTTKLPPHMLEWWLSYNNQDNNNKSGSSSSSSNRRKK